MSANLDDFTQSCLEHDVANLMRRLNLAEQGLDRAKTDSRLIDGQVQLVQDRLTFMATRLDHLDQQASRHDHRPTRDAGTQRLLLIATVAFVATATVLAVGLIGWHPPFWPGSRDDGRVPVAAFQSPAYSPSPAPDSAARYLPPSRPPSAENDPLLQAWEAARRMAATPAPLAVSPPAPPSPPNSSNGTHRR